MTYPSRRRAWLVPLHALGAEHPRVQVAEAASDAVRRRLGEDQHAEHREDAEDMYDEKGSCGFSFGNGCSGGETRPNLFGAPARKKLQTPTEVLS